MKHRIKDFACTVASMLERGERVVLECVDIKNAERIGGYRVGLITSEIVVHSTGRYGELIIGDGSDEDLFIAEEEFKYFKIKEPEYTFHDLIDVAVQAVRDEVLSRYIYYTKGDGDEVIALYVGEDLKMQFFTGEERRGIERIKSLYTETFVIESEEDISRVKSGADIELANGNKCTFLNDDDMWRIKDNKGFSHNCGLLVLKGATVTQKRGDS